MDSLIDQQSPPSLDSVRDKLILGGPRFGTVGVRDEHDRPTMENVAALLSEYETQIAAMAARLEGYQVRAEFEADRAHTAGMTDQDYRHELSLRDEQLRRELDLRHESMRQEQAIRDKAWEQRFSGFLDAQAERDKRLDESVASIKSDIASLGSLKLNIWGAMLTAIGILVAIAGLSLAFYQTGKADSSSPASATQPAQKTAPATPPLAK